MTASDYNEHKHLLCAEGNNTMEYVTYQDEERLSDLADKIATPERHAHDLGQLALFEVVGD